MAKKLTYLKRELDLKEGAGIVYGISDNYLATFVSKKKEIEIFIDAKVDASDTEAVERLREFIQKNATGYKITASSLTRTGISITVGEHDQEIVLELYYLLINQLKVLKIPGTGYCSNCGQKIPGARQIVKINNHVHACDQRCAQRIMESDKGKAMAKKKSTRAPLGMLGAFLFSALGTIPYLYLGYKGFPCWYAAILIPIFCWLGYFIFGGKPSILKVFTCILFPILFFAAASLGLLGNAVYTIWMQGGLVFSTNDVITAVIDALKGNATIQTEFINKQLIYGGIFVLIGYIFTLPHSYGKSQPEFAILKDNL